MEKEKLVALDNTLVELKRELEDAKNLPDDDKQYITLKIKQFEQKLLLLKNRTEDNSETNHLIQKVADFERAIYHLENE